MYFHTVHIKRGNVIIVVLVGYIRMLVFFYHFYFYRLEFRIFCFQFFNIADQYDYYYVPTFYVDGVKVHEAGIFKNEMEALLRKVIE